MQQNGLVGMEHQSHQTYSGTMSTDAPNLHTSKLKNKEFVKITPVATKNSTMRLHQQQVNNNMNVLSPAASQSNQSNRAQTKILTKGDNRNSAIHLTSYV